MSSGSLFPGQGQVLPPCQTACPAGIRARDYVALIAQGRFAESLSLIRERMPFPSACGRVCYHPCESECNRGLVDEPIDIMHLKRFVFDWEFRSLPSLPRPLGKTREEKIAIIGAGPCGLAAAQDLARLGYPVTLFESQPSAGGTMRIAIHKYHLPKDMVDWDIQNVLALGPELKTRVALGIDFSLAELRRDGYQAILVASGAGRSLEYAQPEAGIFAEGHFAFGTLWTVDAVGAGHRAASAIHHYLQKVSPVSPEIKAAKRTTQELGARVKKGYIKPTPRYHTSAWKKEQAFHEIELGFDEETALAEARRCLSCGSAEILPQKCVSCLTCLRVCPYEVPATVRYGKQELLDIREDRCMGCAICVGECPAKAIIYSMPGSQDLPAQMERALASLKGQETALLLLCCSYNAYVHTAFSRFAQVLPVPLITVPCLSKLDVSHFLRAFELGADGLLVAGCVDEECYFEGGFRWAQRRAETASGILSQVGIDDNRIEIKPFSKAQFDNLGQEVKAVVERLKGLGPSPMKRR
ncbi:MAG: hydrogenase iron-sulfur subunit [Chloroflexota bacterium]